MSDLRAECARLLRAASQSGAHELFTTEAVALLTTVRNTAIRVGDGKVIVDVQLARCAVAVHWARYVMRARQGSDDIRDLAGALAVLAAFSRDPRSGRNSLSSRRSCPPSNGTSSSSTCPRYGGSTATPVS